MPFFTPTELIEAESGLALESFLDASIAELQTALPKYEDIKNGDKRLYILPLVLNAGYKQLAALSEKSNSLNVSPVERSFLFRLNDAIALRKMIVEFDNENYAQLDNFIKFDGDKLREFADVIINMRQSTANLLIGEVLKFHSQSVSGLNKKLRTTLNVDVDAIQVPIFASLRSAIATLYAERGVGFKGVSVRFLAVPEHISCEEELALEEKSSKNEDVEGKETSFTL